MSRRKQSRPVQIIAKEESSVPLLEEEDLTAPVDLETVKKFKAFTEGLAKRMDGFNNPKVEVEEDEDRLIISEDNNNDSAPVPTEHPQNGVGHLPEVSMDQHDQVPEESSTDGSRSSSVSMEGSSGAEGLNALGQLSAIRGIHVVPLVKDQSPSKTRRKSDLIPAIKFNGQDRWICPKDGCLEDFFELTPFTKHLRGHNQPGGNCVFCDKKLSSQSSLDRHMLVHSGERPFECKVCGLTFTTNGNMHRHRRTHFEGGKEDGVLNRPGEFSTPPPPPMKKRGKRKNADLPSLMPTTKRYNIEGGALDNGVNLLVDNNKLQQLGGSTLTLASYQGFLNTGGDHEQAAAGKMCEEVLVCPVCENKFSSLYGLQAHLDTHPEEACTCAKCKKVVANPAQLYLHMVLSHTEQMVAPQVEELGRKKSGSSNGGYRFSANPPIGFNDLAFMEFSSEKFSLVAKAWCEENHRQPSSKIFSFLCAKCQHAFPSADALKLHLETHAPENKAKCRKCDANFASRQEYELHSMQHLAAKVISAYGTNQDGSSKVNDVQDVLSKEEFLLSVGLKLARDKVPLKRPDKLVPQDGLDLTMMKASPPATPTKPKKPSRKNMPKKSPSNDQFLHRMPSAMYKRHTELKIPQVPLLKPASSSSPSSSQATRPRCSDGAEDEDDDDLIIIEPTPSTTTTVSAAAPLASGGVGPWKCNFCPEVFSVYRAYQDHLRAHVLMTSPTSLTSIKTPPKAHSKPETTTTTSTKPPRRSSSTSTSAMTSPTPTTMTTTTVLAYACQYCSYTSPDKSTLLQHLRVHTKLRPYQCTLCKLAFSIKTNCERHVRNCHGIESAQDIAGHMLIHPLNGGGDTIASSTTCHQCGENMYSLENLLVHQRTSPYCQLAAGGSPLVAGAWTTHMNGLHLLGNSAAAATAQSGIRVIIPDEFSVHTPPAHHLAYSYTPSHYSRRYNVTQSPLADVPVKQEDSNSVDDDDCQPLDFSMKSKSRSSEGPAPSPVGAQECPIDLTKATDAATAHKQTTLTN